jgi:hypothetical protein
MMRDNGLPAATWAFLADVAPPIAVELLDLLGTVGIAARATPYAEESPAGYSAIGPSHHLNRGPLERVDVDSTRRAEALELLNEHLPTAVAPLEAAAADSARVDAEFNQIIAGIGPMAPPQAADGRTAGYADPLAPDFNRGDAEGFPDLLSADSDNEGYIPPEPPPIPRGTKGQRLSWVVLVLGPIYLIFQGATGWGLGPLGNLVTIIGIVASFVYLLSTLRDSRDEDEDDGAVV